MKWLLVYLFPLTALAAPLTWEDCVRLATRNNPELSAAQSSFQSTREQEGVARSGFLPSVSGTVSYGKSDNSSINGDSNGSYTAALNASENLFSGLSDSGRLAQAKANTRAAEANLQILKARISYDLKSAYQGLRYAMEYKRLTAEILKRREENLRLVELRFLSGRENKGSVLLSQAYLEQARYDDLQAHNAERVAQAQLARALGLEDPAGIEIQGEIPVRDPASPDMNSLALTTPDYRQTVAQAEAASAAVTVARSGFLPSLNLSGSVGNQGAYLYPDERDKWSVGVNLTLPLFNGGKDYYATRGAQDTRRAADESRIAMSRQVRSKLEQAYAAYAESAAKLRVDDSFQKAALVRAEVARKKYNTGLLSFEDWDVIENDLISRQKSFLQSRRDRVTAEAAWEQAQGRGALP